MIHGIVIGLVCLAGLYVVPSTRAWLQNLTLFPTDQPAEVDSLATPSRSGHPTPTVVRRQKNAGAEAGSVAAPQSLSVQTPIPVPTSAPNDSQFAFLLLGYGGGGHDGAYLTDSLIVVVVDPIRKTLTMLSLPRDSWVPLTFNPKTTVYNKVNTAYAFAEDPTMYPDRLPRYSGDQGPGTFASDTVSRLLGIPIRYYLALDFQGFRTMIDAVGGIDVDVPESFAARYPANDDPSVDASWTVVRFRQGVEHMNGERAIEFARARETIDNVAEGTDFARSRRQRLILESFKTRLFEPGGLIHLPQLLAIGSQHVETNYAIPGAAPLAQLALGWKSVTFYQTALTSSNYLEDATGPDGTYIVVPGSPDHSWAQVRALVRRLWKDPALGVALAAIPIVVQNDTGAAGTAGRVTETLLKLGYQVGDPTTGPRHARTRLVDRTGGKAAHLIPQIATDLHLQNLDVAVEPVGDTPELVLELGEDNVELHVSVPPDTTAPYSLVGVQHFGSWETEPAATPPETGRWVVPLAATATPPGSGLETGPSKVTPTPSRTGASTGPVAHLTPSPHPTALTGPARTPSRMPTPSHS